MVCLQARTHLGGVRPFQVARGEHFMTSGQEPNGESRQCDRAGPDLYFGIEKVRQVHITIRWVTTALCLTASIALICWAVVRVTSQPPWLVLCLAIFGPSGLIAILFIIYMRYLAKRLNRLRTISQDEPDEHEDK